MTRRMLAFLLGLAVLIIAALRLWAWDLQMEIKVLESIVQVEQQSRRKSAEQAKQWEKRAGEWEEVAKHWERNSNEFENVVKTYEKMYARKAAGKQ